MARETTQLDLAPATPSSAESAMPPAPRLRLAPGRAGRGVMDGGWWPRSRNTTAELTELVAALTEPGNTVTRVNIDFDDWDAIPLRIIVRGREVRVGWLVPRCRRRSWPPATSPPAAVEPPVKPTISPVTGGGSRQSPASPYARLDNRAYGE
ncbi:DUF5994 family protein [Actinomadura madurae]|uniref:DUF5994 family protein n=1 Tax=Actinomadura madurae TaxID=1993 RepID=UPI003999B611